MKLSREQIKQVKHFVSNRGFTFYDVQLEIIDHVACKVEDLMTADPGLTLSDAIAQTHAGFGVTGFSVVEDAMRVSLQKRYWKMFWVKLLSYLKPVYLPLEAGFVYLVYLFIKTFNWPDALIEVAWAAVFILIGTYVIINYRQMRKYRSMLTMHMGGIAILMINLPVQLFTWLPNIFKGMLNNDIMAIIMGLLLTLLIVAFVTLQQIQKIALRKCYELEEQYQLTVGG